LHCRLAEAAGLGDALTEADNARKRIHDTETVIARSRDEEPAVVGAKVERGVARCRPVGGDAMARGRRPFANVPADAIATCRSSLRSMRIVERVMRVCSGALLRTTGRIACCDWLSGSRPGCIDRTAPVAPMLAATHGPAAARLARRACRRLIRPETDRDMLKRRIRVRRRRTVANGIH
jgi:hypothetical protein